MNKEPFSINSYIYSEHAKRGEKAAGAVADGHKRMEYSEVLSHIQQMISQNHSTELAQVLHSKEAEKRLKTLIIRYLNSSGISSYGNDNLSALTDKIYNDMAGIGLLTPYLPDSSVEELNVNGDGGIWAVYSDRKERLDEAFASPEECSNMVRKMSRFGNVILDESKPVADSYLSAGVRISAAISPCVSKQTGAIASIRKQKPTSMTKQNLIDSGSASELELDFLTMCINNGVSVAFAGATGSGKTADMGWLLSTAANDTRIVTIEDTSELNLVKRDENGRHLNDVVHLLTKEGSNPVTMDDLLRLTMRLHPDILVPAEMRGKEANTCQEAGRTGHTVTSTLHANSAKAAYDRILTMCLMANTGLSEIRLLKNIIEAFPIMVFKKRLPDGSRRYMEVFEATSVSGGEVRGNYLFRFKLDGYTRDSRGKITAARGRHIHCGTISKHLADELFISGVPEEVIRKYTESGDLS